MNDLLYNNLGDWGLLLIPFLAGIFTSFATGFFDSITPEKIKSKGILILVSIGIVFLVMNLFPSYYTGEVYEYIFWYIINLSVAWTYYKLLGKYTVDLVFRKFKQQLNDKVKNVE